MTLTAQFDQSLNEILDSEFPGRGVPDKIGVAVSGGGDSVALLHLLAHWAATRRCSIRAVTVDHGLRAGARAEAELVAGHCATLGICHDIVNWTGWDGTGNLQDQARRGRYRCIGDWAADHGIADVALGHTLDDQAETVLMRLARGSGVDGLSAMAAARVSGGVRWLRPLLNVARDDLRDYLRARDVDWAEDPSNQDPRFDRVRIREVLKILQPLGITRQGLADTAGRMASARHVLAGAAHAVALQIAHPAAGSVTLDMAPLADLAPETRRRLLAHTLCWVAGAKYPPRNAALRGLEAAIGTGNTTTLHGCLITPGKSGCVIGREPAAVGALECDTGGVWDARWVMHGPHGPGYVVRATGADGLKSCADWRDCGLSRATLLAAPAIWSDGQLVAAPLAGYANGWRAELIHTENHFFASILSH